MDEKRFEEIAAEEWAHIPERFQGKMDNVALLIEDEPSEQVRIEEGLDEHHTLLGLYHGHPLTSRGDLYGVGGTLPDTITLYRLPLLDEALHEFGSESEEFVRAVIRETIWHEVGHYFGLDDEEIHGREDEGTNRY